MATINSRLDDIPVFPIKAGSQGSVFSKLTQIEQFTVRGTIGTGKQVGTNIPLERPPFINVEVPPAPPPVP